MKASDCKCVKCGEIAYAFWPVVDPDIPSYPYCKKCLEEQKLKLWLDLDKDSKKWRKK